MSSFSQLHKASRLASKCFAIILCSAIFSVSVCAGTTPVFAEEEQLAPGPCLEKRTQIRKAIDDAGKHNIGVKPYVEAAAAIEADVKAGKPESEIAPRADRLRAALYSQSNRVNNSRALNSGATRATGSVSEAGVSRSEAYRMSQIRYLSEPDMERIMVTLVNNQRKASGLTTLRTSGALVILARRHARDMVRRDYFSHYNPENQDALGRAAAVGLKIPIYENIANCPCKGYAMATVKAAHKALMESPGHRKTILDPELRSIGIGICYDKTYGIRVTQNFSTAKVRL